MNPILEKFKQAAVEFDKERQEEGGAKIMNKITDIVNELGQRFEEMDGGELAEYQIKIAGYKFYLADYLASLQQRSEALKVEIKNIRAQRWEEVAEEIKAQYGKVKNKEQIENVLTIETQDLVHQQILYETMWYKYKLKLSAIDDILTAIVQQIAQRKREVELSQQM